MRDSNMLDLVELQTTVSGRHPYWPCAKSPRELFVIGENILSSCHATTNQFCCGRQYLVCGDFHGVDERLVAYLWANLVVTCTGCRILVPYCSMFEGNLN